MPEQKRILPLTAAIYAACFLPRVLEYFILRTDQSILGEAFIHKLIGIAILFAAARALQLRGQDIGFARTGILRGILRGILFGVCVFVVAYLFEIGIAAAQGSAPVLKLYVSAYAVDGNIGERTEPIFFLICILGNIINVVMEEGVFRGLFPRLLQQKYSFICSAIIASVLFGFWHIMGPVRNYFDGIMSLNGFIANCIMLITTSALVGFKFCLMSRLTGSIYMAMGDHFVNNTIVNILHVASTGGTDTLMFARITIAQALSFCIVLIWYLRCTPKDTRMRISS